MLAVIGTGNMGRALTAGLIAKNIFSPDQIIGTDPVDAAKNEFLKIAPNLQWTKTPESACAEADVVLISVKPQQLNDVLPSLKNSKPLYLSIAAGVPIQRLEELLENDSRIVRAMPNTPALLNCGVTAFAGNARVAEKEMELAEKIFSAVGNAYRVPEDSIDAVTALSGSGPAYFYLFIDSLRKAAEARGLDSKISLEMATRTALGAAQMILQTQKSPEELIAQVKSKGGTTEAALNTFAKENFSQICQKAVDSAYQRSKELASSTFS